MQNIRLKAIAEELGVSYMTLYRVINGIPKVREQTRNRVIDALNKHGFSNLECRKQRRIVYAFNNPSWGHMSNVMERINASILPGNYQMETVRPDLYSAEFMAAVEKADYIVLFENITEKFVATLRECNPDLTIISLFNGAYGDILITPDDFTIGTMAADYIYRKGHRNHIAVLTAVEDRKIQSSFVNRYRGFMSQMKVLSPKCRVDLLDCTMSRKSCIRRIASYFRGRKSMPTAFFCTGHFFLGHLCTRLAELNLCFPENVGLLGCDKPDYAQSRKYDAVTFDLDQLVDLARFFLTSNIVFRKVAPIHLKLGCRLKIEGTLKDVSELDPAIHPFPGSPSFCKSCKYR